MPETTTKPISLGKYFKQFVEKYPSEDRGTQFLDDLMESIPEDQYEFYLREALRRVIPVLNSDIRRSASAPVTEILGTPKSSTFPGKGAVNLSRTKQAHIPSKKQEALREVYWPEFLRANIPTESGQKKALGFATAADLRFNAQQRRNVAHFTLVEAERYERYAELVETNNVATLGDLDISIIEAAFS